MNKIEPVTCSCCQEDIDERNLIRILTEEKELTDANLARLKKALEYKRQLHTGEIIVLTMDSLITINNIITNSNNFHLRRVNVRPAGSNNTWTSTTLSLRYWD